MGVLAAPGGVRGRSVAARGRPMRVRGAAAAVAEDERDQVRTNTVTAGAPLTMAGTPQATMLTNRPGTTISLRGAAPFSSAAIFSSASAADSIVALSASAGT